MTERSESSTLPIEAELLQMRAHRVRSYHHLGHGFGCDVTMPNVGARFPLGISLFFQKA